MSETYPNNNFETMAEPATGEAGVAANYPMRNIDAQDIILLSTIISKIGFKEFARCFDSPELQAAVSQSGDGKAAAIEQIGMAVVLDIAGIVIANIPKCADDIFRFVASLTGKDTDHIRHMPLDGLLELLVAIVKKDEFKAVFRVASKLFK